LPTAIVDFKPGEGVKITAGYQLEPHGQLVRKNELKLTRDGGFAWVGNVIRPVQQARSEELTRLIEEGIREIPLEKVPEFFMRDLVLLKTDLSAVLTDRAKRVRIVSEPIKPRVTIYRNEPGWLDFVVEYEADGFVLPERAVRKAVESGSSHVQHGEYSFLKVDEEAYKRRIATVYRSRGSPRWRNSLITLEDFALFRRSMRRFFPNFQDLSRTRSTASLRMLSGPCGMQASFFVPISAPVFTG